MDIFEYLTRNCQGKPYFDEVGNIYVDEQKDLDKYVEDFMLPIDHSCYFLSKAEYEKYAKIEITLTDDIDDSIYDVRRPYFRLRGKSVSKEQAFEIIRRVDRFFKNIEHICDNCEFIYCLNFRSNIIPNTLFGHTWGWIHTDGFVGVNDITYKYPEENEFITEWVKYLAEFPFLDIIIAITYWDEIPLEVWEKCEDDDCWDADDKYDKSFLRAIVCGIYVHDNKVELLNSTDARAKYIEYDALYGGQKARCSIDYCRKNNVCEADLGYVRKCIEAYGLNADEELAKLPEHYIKEFDKVVGTDSF